jgi:hypothetical protein
MVIGFLVTSTSPPSLTVDPPSLLQSTNPAARATALPIGPCHNMAKPSTYIQSSPPSPSSPYCTHLPSASRTILTALHNPTLPTPNNLPSRAQSQAHPPHHPSSHTVALHPSCPIGRPSCQPKYCGSDGRQHRLAFRASWYPRSNPPRRIKTPHFAAL